MEIVHLIATTFCIIALPAVLHRQVRKNKLSWFLYSGGATIICTLFPLVQQALFLSRWGWGDVLDPYLYNIEPHFFLGPVGLLIALVLANRFLPDFGSSEFRDLHPVLGAQLVLYWLFCVVLFYLPFVIHFYVGVLMISLPFLIIIYLVSPHIDRSRYRGPYYPPYEE